MATQLLVFSGVSLVLLLWNTGAAVCTFRRRRAIPMSIRWSSWLTVILPLPALVAWQQAFDTGDRSTLALSWLYPLMYFLAAWQSAHTPGRGRIWLTLYNTLIGVVLSLRLAEYMLGDLGLTVAGLQVAFTRVQMASVMMMALWVQLPFYPPVLMLPPRRSSPDGAPVRRTGWWLIPAIPACLLSAAILALTPHGYAYAGDWRGFTPDRHQPRSAFRQGAVIRLSAKAFPDARWLAIWSKAIDDGRFRAVNLFIDSDLASSPALLRKAVAFADELRDRGLTVIITSDFTKDVLHGRYTRTPQGLCQAMTPWSLHVLRAFRPTHFVPIIEPYGAAAVMLRNTPQPEAWRDALGAMFTELRRQAPNTRLCVYFTPNDRDTALYRLCAAKGFADVMGFSFYSLDEDPQVIRQRLEAMDRLVQRHGRGKEHWLFEYGHSPVTSGGERAQTVFIRMVSGHAADNPAYTGACVFALDDREEKLGLLDARGRRREAFHALAHR